MSRRDSTSSPQPWRRLETISGSDYGIFQSRHDVLRNPRTGEAMKRVVLESPDWINVVAVTPQSEIVVVKQYRFGIEAVTVEIPGGMVDAGETPEEAARRELSEETGYEAETWRLLAAVEPNPAFLNNLCYHFLAMGARQASVPHFEGGEDITIGTLAFDEMAEAIANGEIRHSLVISAICRVLDLRRNGAS